jgi:hypothetical protein
MRQLAQSIIDTQQAEIELMQHWIAALEADKDTADDKVKNKENNQPPAS